MGQRAAWTAAVGLVAALGVATAVTAVPTAAEGSGDDPIAEHRAVSCRTDASGSCSVTHALGVVPSDIEVTPRFRGGRGPYTLSVVPDSETDKLFSVRASLDDGLPKGGSRIWFRYSAYATPTVASPSTSTTTAAPTTTESTTAVPAPTTAAPTTADTTTRAAPSPADTPARICGSDALNGGPTTAPTGAVVVPAGNNENVDFAGANTTYWFAPGVHTLGSSEFGQISPGDGATFVGAPGAVIDGKDVTRYLFTGHAENVKVRYLTVTGFAPPIQEGVVNHDGGDGWLMEHLYVHNNNGSAVMFGSDNVLRDSCLTNNGQYAWNSIGQSSNIVMERNEISYNNTGDWETKLPGCGCSGGGKFWDVHHVVVRDNWVHHNHGAGIWADQNNYDFLIEGNLIEDNEDQAIFYETSYNAVIKNNVLRRNSHKIGKTFAGRGDTFPIGTIYLSEAGYDPRLPAPEGATAFLVQDNVLENNWGGIAAWENADRFCNSPANTSTGYCTLPGYKTSDCTQPGIASEPLYSHCRWSTKNLLVTGNTFKVDVSQMGNCAPRFCATQAVFSNYGTVPDWSPYKGRVIQEAITFKQNNKWSNNTYVGPWHWVAYEPGRYLTFAQWQAAPYHQDAGSS